ncbi:MAG: hypothetical protein AAFU54_19115 [Chloroflexota bacterium]
MIINTRTELGGATYPFLHRLQQKWFIHSWDVDDDAPAHYNAPKSLRWINGNHVSDLYVEDMDTRDFLKQSGLQPRMQKGGFVLSKRISRLMRPYFMYGFFPRDEISIKYLNQDAHGEKVWDGAGQVRRSVLLRVLDQMPPLAPEKQREMETELRTAKRIEFTIMGAGEWSNEKRGGQDKGHAIVFEDHELEADFVLPQDTKGEVVLNDGSVFIGLYPVHHADTMRLDIQSLINLWGFFRHDDLMTWLHEEGELFLHSVQNGDVAAAMHRIDQTDVDDDDEALEAITNWHIREYLASGGDPMWFGSIVKGLINQHLKRLNHSSLGRFRLPIPGGRYYVMTDEIGRLDIPPGEIKLDPESSTAWVNADDWVTHIADVLGGADQDDALWVFPFLDFDDSEQILAWRSPNQLGEYMVFKPTTDSHIPDWQALTRAIEFPPADSRDLPSRIDQIQPDYLNLVNPDTAGGLGEWLKEYTIEGMEFTIRRASQNRGALGMYCNALLLARALYNTLPSRPPAPLEDVIDGSVKTGTDLQAVKEWCFTISRKIVEARKPVPARLHERLSLANERGKPPLIPETSINHWFDKLIAGIEEHIAYIQKERDVIMTQASPPIDVFRIGHDTLAMLEKGARFNQLYTSNLPWASKKRQRHSSNQDTLDTAREETTHYLASVSGGDTEEQYRILLAALAHYYTNPDHIGRDESVWQLGPVNHMGTRDRGIAQDTIQALREVGILDQLNRLDNGRIVRYPSARVLPTANRPIKIIGVWFNYWRAVCAEQGREVPERMQDVEKPDAEWAKQQVEQLAHSTFRNMTIKIMLEGDRAVAHTEKGIFGYIAKDNTQDVVEGLTRLKYIVAKKDVCWAIFGND